MRLFCKMNWKLSSTNVKEEQIQRRQLIVKETTNIIRSEWLMNPNLLRTLKNKYFKAKKSIVLIKKVHTTSKRQVRSLTKMTCRIILETFREKAKISVN